MSEMPLLQARIPEPDKEKLKKIAKERGMSLSDLVRRIISKALIEKLHEKV